MKSGTHTLLPYSFKFFLPGTETERNFGQFGKRYPSTDDDEYDSTPNVSFPLPEAGTRLEWESLLVTVEIQGTSYRYRDKLPLCKWNL